MASTVQVACIQYAPTAGQISANRNRTGDYLRAARRQGADLAILPELAVTGYHFPDRQALRGVAEPATASPTLDLWRGLAQTLDLHIIGGFAERDGERLFNSAALITPEGDCPIYRKPHLSDREKHLFEAGDGPLRAWSTRVGRIGLMICYDLWFPEAARCCALAGADLIALPTNWHDLPGDADDSCPMALSLAAASAHCNRVFLACANRVGEEAGIQFSGCSAIFDPTGHPVGERLGRGVEGILSARIDPLAARDKHLTALNSVLADRRPDLYHESDGWSSE